MLQRISVHATAKCFCLLTLLCLASQIGYSQDRQKQNATAAVALESGKPIERNFAGGLETHGYRINLAAGQYAKISVEQREVDVAAELRAEDGTLIIRFDKEIRLKEKEEIEIVAAQTGEYRLDLKTKHKSDAGRYEIVLAESREANEKDRMLFEGQTLYWKADVLNLAGKYADAAPPAIRALEIAEKHLGASDPLVGFYLNKVAYLQRQLGKYAEAEATIQRALAIDEKALGNDHPQTFAATDTLALIYRSKDDYANADRMFRWTIETIERVLGKEHPVIAGELTNFSALLHVMGDSELGKSVLQRALAVAEKHFEPDSETLSKILNNLGTIYLDDHDYEQAEPLIRRALAISEKNTGTETNGYSELLQNLGIIIYNKKDYAQALALYERALTIREKTLGQEHLYLSALLNSIANVYHAMGNLAKALEIQERARVIAEKGGGLYHSYAILSLRSTARYYTAAGNAEKAVEFQLVNEDRTETKLALDLAVGSERQKLVQLDELAARTSRTISLNVGLAADNSKASELSALVILQRKGRVLDAMAQNVAALRERSDADDRKLLDELNALTSQLAKITLSKPAKLPIEEQQKQIAELKERKEKLEAEMSSRSAAFRAQSKPITLAAVKAEIPIDAALIEFAIYQPYDPKILNNDQAYGKARYIAYVLRRDGGVKWKELGDAETIDRKIDEWRKALRDAKRKDAQELARSVDGKIMQPVRALLGDAKQLLISPDGALNLIPFEALVDEQNRYLIDHYSFTYLTSGRDLLRMNVARVSKSKELLIADPQFGGSPAEQSNGAERARDPSVPQRTSVTATRTLSETYFAPLSGTLQEARAIQSVFPEALCLTGTAATEAALKNANAPRVLHVATHGFFLSEPPSTGKEPNSNPLLRSGLALTNANSHGSNSGAGDDGILTALEASGLNLWGTRLVVLSACDTGVGEVRNGEGVYGLRRAFVLAGSESLVMSLWPVSDYSTRRLMTDYYQNLKKGQGRGAALRQVQLHLLKTNPHLHPFYWANFIQSGEWANLNGER